MFAFLLLGQGRSRRTTAGRADMLVSGALVVLQGTGEPEPETPL
jgi:hypothetical protein